MKQKVLLSGWLFLSIFLLTELFAPVQAQNSEYLHVYMRDGMRSFALDEMQKITFSGQKVNVHSIDGDATELDFSNVLKLTFGSETIGNETAIIDSGVKVYSNGSGNLIIESVHEILTVNLFDLQGRLLQSTAPQCFFVTLNLSSSSTDVCVVQVLTSQGVSAHKIVLR